MSGKQHGDPNLGFYGLTLAEGADDAERVGWESKAIQRLRFEALLEAVISTDYGPELSLLDVGCGFGALVGYLQETGREVDYLGIDLHPEMIVMARSRFPGVRFEQRDLRDVEGTCDVVLCSGALSVRLESEEDSWSLIEQMYACCRRVTTLNLQSRRVLEVGAKLRSDFWLVEPEAAYARLRKIADRVVIREDTVPSDLVVYLYKDYFRSVRGAFWGVSTRAELAEVALSRDAPGEAYALLADADLTAMSSVERADHLNLQAVAASMCGETDAVENALREAHEADPANADVADNWSRLLMGAGALRQGEAVIERCLKASPDLPAARRDELRRIVHVAWILNGDTEAAMRVENAAETRYAGLIMRGSRQLIAGSVGEALNTAQQALKERPFELEAVLLLARAHERQGDAHTALELCARVLSEAPHEDEALELAQTVIERGQELGDEEGVAFRALLEELAVNHEVLGPLVLEVAT